LGKWVGDRGIEKWNNGRVRDHIMIVGWNTPQQVYKARSRSKILKCPGASRTTKELEVLCLRGRASS